jgi:hypothetical protein
MSVYLENPDADQAPARRAERARSRKEGDIRAWAENAIRPFAGLKEVPTQTVETVEKPPTITQCF